VLAAVRVTSTVYVMLNAALPDKHVTVTTVTAPAVSACEDAAVFAVIVAVPDDGLAVAVVELTE
jgi:hypothetical protein